MATETAMDIPTASMEPAAHPAQASAIVPISPAAEAWALAQRRAKALGASTLVPEAYRGPQNIGNVLIALDMADRLGASAMLVMQNLHVIGGRPSWSASFLIATVNQCGRFTPLRFEIRGGDDPRGKEYRVRAYAEDKASGERCDGEWISWDLVQGEGWDRKTGSKWKTMPGQMFRYRAAAFWTRVFAPEVSMGILTADEVDDLRADPPPSAPALAHEPKRSAVDDLAATLGIAPPSQEPAGGTQRPQTANAPSGAESPAGGTKPFALDASAPASSPVCRVCGSAVPSLDMDSKCFDCSEVA